jgi:hypothetical protein
LFGWRLFGCLPGFAEFLPEEESEWDGDGEQDRLVYWTRDREQAEGCCPAEWFGDARVGGGDPHGSDEAAEVHGLCVPVPA